MAKLHLCQQILDILWPVGSIYLSTDTTNPSTKFGGTWKRETGGFLYGSVTTTANSNTFSTGNIGSGTKTNNHTLSIEQIPSHNHQFKQDGGGNVDMISPTCDTATQNSWGNQYSNASSWVATTRSYTIANKGGGQGHQHNIPYIACSIWRRTA